MINKRLQPLALFSFSLAVVWLANAATSAQSIDGTFKMGVESRLFRFASITAEVQGPYSSGEETIELVDFGLFSFGSTRAGLFDSLLVPAAAIGADLAYGVTDNLLLGSRLMVDHGRFMDGEELSSTQFAIVPHFDYVFTTNSSFRPFLGAQFGAQGSYLSGDGGGMFSYLFLMGLSLGGFAFVADNISIDPRISFFYSLGSADMEDVDSPDLDSNGFSIALMIGLSGWI